ncbi:MAG TPA: alpha/beta fold hydrolase [Gammaproteobacteria bacterium]|nr:alpha/beta fold hydrolase [Gammaproteobacteria bacterium]
MKFIHIIFILLISLPAQADVMLLIHGYLGDADSWEKSGINDELQQHGWQRAGVFRGSPQGPQLFVTEHTGAKNTVYVAELPSTQPVINQADVLKNIIDIIQQTHAGEKLILVGHSAGGVVARMALIRHRLKNIEALITIASPHLGTGRADQALNITANHGPFNMVKSFVGGRDYDALKHSRGLMFDLRRPQPGNMLYWLNSQPHPNIDYASVIRLNNDGNTGDYYVPGYSQNMNNVPALQGKSSTYTTPTSHFLVRQDADTILTLIAHFQESSD